ncbi:alpha/beta-hydrolase [Violaceomyces palustris]|uniref:Alpha/beta-hydrolase n=1 Tax=Violaceomyces palustris TaxID=1673888 RepID=A0ACD0NS90_9BASI|nr:alpha/beta-hydrolase [Violaceomyces palustris]
MPFLPLPKDKENLRFSDGEVSFHYLVSTPSCQTFLNASQNAASLDILSPFAEKPHIVAHGATIESASKFQLPDPNFPLLIFIPSECFSCTHLFADQLCDPGLANSFNLVAVDPRGHGLTKEVSSTSSTARRYDLDCKAADILTFIQELCNQVTGQGKHWPRGVHLFACSMSGLVGLRMASAWPDLIKNLVIVSPITEVESPFIIESFQGVRELLEETWEDAHSGRHDPDFSDISLPGEVVQGLSYRWAGEEAIPQHISSYLKKTWLQRLVLRLDGKAAARDWWFGLYWLRKQMTERERLGVRCEILVIEGTNDLPNERQVGQEIGELCPNAKSFQHVAIEDSPFLLSVKRPEKVTELVCNFLFSEREEPISASRPRPVTLKASEQTLSQLTLEERFELLTVYATGARDDSSDDCDDDDDDATSFECDDDEEGYEHCTQKPEIGEVENGSGCGLGEDHDDFFTGPFTKGNHHNFSHDHDFREGVEFGSREVEIKEESSPILVQSDRHTIFSTLARNQT